MPQEATFFSKGDVLHETYRIKELIGVGGTGEVYRADNIVSRRTVAIKILKREFSSDERFIDLMRSELIRNVNNDAVVNYYDLLRTKEYGGLYFLVMEYIGGRSLAKLMAQGPVPVETVLQILRQVASGLRAVHAAKVLHRDISPDNILLRDGDPARATLIDFGIAKDLKPEAYSVIRGGFAGTYQYSAPEQMDGKAVPQSDLYSLGATLLAAARGAPPDLPSDLYAIRKYKDQPLDLSDLPEPLRGLIARMAAPDLTERFASAEELERALAGAHTGPELPRISPPEHGPDRRRQKGDTGIPGAKRRGRRAGTIAVMLGGLAVAAAVVAYLGLPLLGPGLPHEDVYRLSAKRDGTVEIKGNAPSEAERDRLIEATRKASGGAQVTPEMILASGEPTQQWAEGIADLIEALAPLESWNLRVIEQRAILRGSAPTEEVAGRVRERAREAAGRAQLSLDLAISALAEQVAEQVEAVLSRYRDCGLLEIVGGADALSGRGELKITGRVGASGALDELGRGLQEAVGSRPLSLEVALLNPYVCSFMSSLSPTGQGQLEIRYTDGGTQRPWSGDSFTPGSNPVIDVVVPTELSGQLYVLLVDNEGSVVSLLPHPGRQENALDRIGEAAGGQRVVRVAYPESEASPEKLSLSFTPPFGANLVVAVVSETPLFDTARLRRESIDAFAPEFQRGIALANQRGETVPLVYRLLTVEHRG